MPFATARFVHNARATHASRSRGGARRPSHPAEHRETPLRIGFVGLAAALTASLMLLAVGCSDTALEGVSSPIGSQDVAGDDPAADDPRTQLLGEDRPGGSFGRLHWSDLTYLGAFKCPDQEFFAWPNGALAYIPTRNTLVVIGKTLGMNWFEISIPSPVISPTKNPADLQEAVNLSGWMDVLAPIHSKLAPAGDVGGLAWFEGRIWAGTYEFYNVAGRDNLGISSVDENFGDARGAWRVGPPNVHTPSVDVFHANKTHSDIMVIPESWSAAFTPGKRLAGGRHREAGAFGGGRGPAVYAFAADFNAPHGADLGGVPLMYFQEHTHVWPGYRNADEYHSTWIWSADQHRQAVLVSAAKGLGPNYYGVGVSCDPAKGWHAYPYEPQVHFIDVNDLGDVAQGRLEPWAVRPYESVVPTDIAWRSPADAGADPNCRLDWFRSFAFDSGRGLLYASQPMAYLLAGGSNRMIIHVWQVS
jgi:hypothetical protein